MSLHVTSFGGGVALVGSPDTQRTDELEAADSLDIGPRGALVAASDVSDYTTVEDEQASRVALSELYGMDDMVADNVPYAVLLGLGKDVSVADRYYAAVVERTGEGPTVATGRVFTTDDAPTINPAGAIVTVVQLPGTFVQSLNTSPTRFTSVLVNIGAREGDFAKDGAGLYVIPSTPGAGPSTLLYPISYYDALGTGGSGEFAGGTQAQQLYFRGIVSYNGYVFGWGFDSEDATNGEGPNRVMFSNPNNPIKWGNDNVAATGTDRLFTDSDAIVLGDAGENVRAGLKWNGKLWFGTNRELHYIGGYGRDSFLTDGSNQVARSYNVIGAHAMIEGPDKLLYGVADQGLWAFDGHTFEPHFKRLVSFAGHSPGWWDLIWTNPDATAGYPGKTNQDLVWMAVDWDREQVLIGIPFCDATSGAGEGADTVVIKFHTRTGGFTRQVFADVAFTAAGYFRRLGQQPATRFLGTATLGAATVQRYGYQATPTDSPIMPAQLPVARLGPYAAFGPDGVGVIRRAYLTLAWESAASLPIVFTVTSRLDQSTLDAFTLTVSAVAPAAPSVGDLWVDTSETDPSLGNATAGSNIPATGGYLTNTWSGSAWRLVPGSGESGIRKGIPMPLTRRVGTRLTWEAQCTAAAGRFQLEGFALSPGGGVSDA